MEPIKNVLYIPIQQINQLIIIFAPNLKMKQQSENIHKTQPKQIKNQIKNIEQSILYPCPVCERQLYIQQLWTHIQKHQELNQRRQTKRKRKIRKLGKIGKKQGKKLYMITNLSKARSRVNKQKKKISEKQKDEDIKIISSKNKNKKNIRGSTQLKKLGIKDFQLGASQSGIKNHFLKNNKKDLNQQDNLKLQDFQNNENFDMFPENQQDKEINTKKQNQPINFFTTDLNQAQYNQTLYQINQQPQKNNPQKNQKNQLQHSEQQNHKIIQQHKPQSQQTSYRTFQLKNQKGQSIAQIKYKIYTEQKYRNLQKQNERLINQVMKKEKQLQNYKIMMIQKQEYISRKLRQIKGKKQKFDYSQHVTQRQQDNGVLAHLETIRNSKNRQSKPSQNPNPNNISNLPQQTHNKTIQTQNNHIRSNTHIQQLDQNPTQKKVKIKIQQQQNKNNNTPIINNGNRIMSYVALTNNDI